MKAELNFTRDSAAAWIDRKRETLPAKLVDGKPVADIPSGATAYYFNTCAESGFVASTPVYHLMSPDIWEKGSGARKIFTNPKRRQKCTD